MEEIKNNNGRMIFISDLEGCASKSPNKKENQSEYICSISFFNKLEQFMEENLNNKIAFLGDYFDQGPSFELTIDNIIELYDSYEDRVYIILGNRDINKLRLYIEPNMLKNGISDIKLHKENFIKVTDDLGFLNFGKNITNITSVYNSASIYGSKGSIWPDGRRILYAAKTVKTFVNSVSKSLKNRDLSHLKTVNISIFKTILNDSMGAKDDLVNTLTIKYFEKKSDVFFKLLNYGKILNYDSDFNVLISHAGGIENVPLYNNDFYNNLIDDSDYNNNNNEIIDYYEKINYYRNKLMIMPDKDSLYNNNNIFDIIDIINKPLVETLKCFGKDINNIENIPKEYYLLQALGLKPDVDSSTKKFKPFLSFIQSCNMNGCKGPYSNKNLNNIFKSNKPDIKKISNLGVKFVAFGHNPICVPVPLIFKRNSSDIVFIANDLSNGHRPISINSTPMACINRKNNSFTTSIININTLTEYETNNNNDLLLKKYKPMLLNKCSIKDTPTFIENTSKREISYKNKVLHFNAYNNEGKEPYKRAVIKNKNINTRTICEIIKKYPKK